MVLDRHTCMKRILPYITLLSLLIFPLQEIFGQYELSYSFENYSNREGFDQNTVWSIEQDKNGVFWIGTSNGLIKYDGYSFYDVSLDTKFKSDIFLVRIRDVLTDDDGLVWILTMTGLNIYYPDRDRFFQITVDSRITFNGLKKDDSGSIWVYGHDYIASVRTELRKDSVITHWTPNLIPNELTNLRINDLLKINEEFYFLATSQGVYKMLFSETGYEPDFILDTILSGKTINHLLRHNDIIWIGTTSGLYKTVLDGRKLRYLNNYHYSTSDPKSIGGDDIRYLLIGPDDNLWIGTWGSGLSMYNYDTDIFTNFLFDPRKNNGISSSRINCIYKDQFNVIWIGTGQGGLCKLDLNRKQFINIEHNPYENSTIPGNLINSILEDSKGYLWISSDENPLCRSIERVSETNINRLTFKRFNKWFNTFSDKNILSIFEDNHGYIWLGYENSVVVYNRDKETFTEIDFDLNGENLPYDLQKVNYIGAIDEKRIMIGGNHIIILDDPWKHIGSGKYSKIPAFSFSNNLVVITAAIEGAGKIWIGYFNQGLVQYSLEGDSLIFIKDFKFIEDSEDEKTNKSIFAILRDKENTLWVGTFGVGLNQMINDTIQSDSKSGQLKKLDIVDNVIYGIIEENDSILWLSTDQGIYKLNKRNMETTMFTMEDGLANNNFRKNAYHKGRSGFYYFGGLNGLTAFKPDQIKANLIAPEIKLSALKINNKKVTQGQPINKKFILENPISEISKLTLTSDDRILALDVVVMHTASPGKNKFSYILEGFDDDWREIGEGSYTLNYTNLSAGKYKLRIRGFNGDGLPSENEKILDIQMLAPWYATWWSKLIFALIGISVIFGIAIYIIKLQNLENKLHFEKIDKERITEINKAKLQFFTNISHEFRTPLALISLPLQKLKELIHDQEQMKHLSSAEKHTGKLIRLIDQLLTFRRIEHGKLDLKYSNTSMDDFLYPIVEAFETLSIKKQIEFYYLVKDPELMFAIDLEKMEQVLYNLLSNAFKFTSAGGRITLEGKSCLIDSKAFVCFEVKDTGKGIPKKDLEMIFERFYQADSELRNMGTGIGLSLSKSIVELHQGFIQVESTPQTGTTFAVNIPFIENYTAEPEEYEIQRIDPNKLLEFEELSAGNNTSKVKQGEAEGTLLIVDDEADFRNAIHDIFKKKFRILEASNGKNGLEIAREENPDLIISDVIMPVMNGYDFCNHVKTDIELCHIPFILLTALEEMGNHIQGLEFGADAYISKPFNMRYLEVSVQKLIDNRKKILEHFKINSQNLPKSIKISGRDRVFIETMNETIRQNLDNSTFGVMELADKINISPSYFYRKLKLLTGQIPNEYIRNFRLLSAADLLSDNPGISVKTVMYEVGFESASHFSHAFKKKFGVSPSDYSS